MDRPKTLDVRAFVSDEGAADNGAHALHKLLEFKGHSLPYSAIKAISGDGFKFVYDKAAVFEALRDLTPTDFFRDCLNFFGIQGAWHTGYGLAEVEPMLESAFAAGNPTITSNLDDSSLGYQLIVGYQPGAPAAVAVRAARSAEELGEDPPARWMAFDRDWDGPVTSRARWDLNPVFVIDSAGSTPTPKPAEQLQQAVDAGLRSFEPFEIAYATSGFDDAYATEPTAGRNACNGLEAWAALGDDIQNRPDLSSFAFTWKVDALAARLRHDRAALAEFFTVHAKHQKGDKAQLLTSLSEVLTAIAEKAKTLRQLAWNQDTYHVQTPEDFQQLMASSRSLAYPVPEHRGFPELLRAVGYEDRMHTTSWGLAIFMDDEVRWQHVARIVDELGNDEADVENFLRRIAD
ncbi:MAG: hypothetical protein COW42_02370 [Deltaproteobacteria bacterium CG17_big_fil_post_rev_8_21_14_2_50_63_7]|nr:MAG: hypothetical protein COW42_02370 [Deltaproteobacteria bacterium CG17_big_fil_post_rev_8_21_14_2_50_63_7]